jgi:hypothetical protein
MNEEYDDMNEDMAEGQAEEQFSMPDQDILSLFSELRKKAKQDDVFRDNGRIVEKLCLGQSVTQALNTTTFMRTVTESPASLILLYNLVLTWAALMTKDRPSVYAVPANSSLEAVAAAEIGTKLIEYIEAEEDMQAKWHSSAINSAQHGTAFLKIVFNPTTQRIEIHNLTIFDVWIQNRTSPADVDWCVIRNYLDQYDALDLLQKVDPAATLPAEVNYTDGANITRTGVEKYEIWYKPSSRYPKGLYACIVSGVVVEAMAYPYVFPEPDGSGQKALLPIVWWNARDTRDSTLGTSWTRECGLIQADINNLYAKKQENARQAKQWMILPSSLGQNDLIDDQNARIYLDIANQADAAMIRWVSPAPLDPNLNAALEDSINSMYRTSGISESTTGNAYASQSGKALSYQAQLDSDKHSWAFKSLERAQRNAWELILKLCQKHYSVPRTFSIAGADPVSFMGADLAGLTVKLQSRSAREAEQSSKVEKTRADMVNGFVGKEALIDSAPSLATAGASMYAAQLVEMYLSGQDIDLTPETLPPEIMVAEIDKRIQSALLNQDFATAQQLNDLKKQYLMMVAGVQSQEGAPSAAAPTSNTPQPLAGSEDLGQRNIMDEGPPSGG